MTSGILTLGLASIAPSAVLSGISVKVLKYYRPQIWIGWCLMIIGIPLFTTIDSNTSSGKVVGFIVIYGVGAGCGIASCALVFGLNISPFRINYSLQVYPVQAGQPVTANAHALAFFAFVRSFSGVNQFRFIVELYGLTLNHPDLGNHCWRCYSPE